ncbi:MAG: PilZ domain-containing protein [Proteobacteria bacterium]|nr:PilZ domain-containing protein [Pseudomonadota bacterium]
MENNTDTNNESEKKSRERRKHKRWILSSYFDTYETKMNSSLGYLADISFGGMMLISKYPVQTNIVLPLRIELNKEVDKNAKMQVITRTVRCDEDKDYKYFNIGLKLIDLSSSNLAIIKRLIEKYAI